MGFLYCIELRLIQTVYYAIAMLETKQNENRKLSKNSITMFWNLPSWINKRAPRFISENNTKMYAHNNVKNLLILLIGTTVAAWQRKLRSH